MIYLPSQGYKIIVDLGFCLYLRYVVITRWTPGGYDIFITWPAKSMHREPFGLSVHAFGWTGDENIMPTWHEAGN